MNHDSAGEYGDVDTSKEREADIVKMKLQSQAVSISFSIMDTYRIC